VGIAIHELGGKILVSGVKSGSSADKAGIKGGDRVVSVGGHAVGKKNVAHVQALISGTPGSRIQVEVTRGSVFWGVPTQIKHDLTRQLPGMSAIQKVGKSQTKPGGFTPAADLRERERERERERHT